MRDDIRELLRKADVKRHWVGLEKAEEEIGSLQESLLSAEQEVSTLDKLNIFTDSPEEVRVKDLRERLEVRRSTVKRDREELSKVLLKLTEHEPHFSTSLELESLLKELLSSSHPAALKSVGAKLKVWLTKHESFNRELSDSPSPEQALSGLLTGSLKETCAAVRMVRALLPLCEERQEYDFEELRQTCSFRPLLLRLVERCRHAFRNDLPEVPWPSDLYRDFWRGDSVPEESQIHKVLRETSGSELERKFEELEVLLQELAGVGLLIELNKKDISLMDRVVFWSDTKAEAQEKTLRETGLALREAMKAGWRELCAVHLARRSEVWAAFLRDESGGISASLKKVSVSNPQGILNKTCQVYHKDDAQTRVDLLQEALRKRYPAVANLHLLRQKATLAAPAEISLERDALGNPPSLSESELVAALAQIFQKTGYGERWARAQSLGEHAKEFRDKYQQARSSQNLLGTLRSFVAPTADERELRKDLETREQEASYSARELKEEYEHILFGLHPPSYLSYLVADLSLKISQIRGEVRSETVRKSDGNSTTRYYSVLLGHGEALASAAKLQLYLQKESQDCPSAFQGLDILAANEVSIWLERQPVTI